MVANSFNAIDGLPVKLTDTIRCLLCGKESVVADLPKRTGNSGRAPDRVRHLVPVLYFCCETELPKVYDPGNGMLRIPALSLWRTVVVPPPSPAPDHP